MLKRKAIWQFDIFMKIITHLLSTLYKAFLYNNKKLDPEIKSNCFALKFSGFLKILRSCRESRDSWDVRTYIPGNGKSRNLSNPEIFCPGMDILL